MVEMRTVPIAEAKARLNELVDEVVTMHGHVTIARRGRPAAVLVSVDEWESLQETLYWQSVPGIREDIARARRAARRRRRLRRGPDARRPRPAAASMRQAGTTSRAGSVSENSRLVILTYGS